MEYSGNSDISKKPDYQQPHQSSKKSMKLRIFNSFKEQEDEMVTYWASITPLQRLNHLYEMITISFRLSTDNKTNPNPPRSIKLISYEP